MARLKMVRAICEAFEEELQRDPTVCLFGEDVGEFGGVFSTAARLQTRFGERRVFDTPLSEGAIIGTAVGAALTGLRPIAEIMYIDFMAVGIDPLVNQAAKLRYMSGGQVKLPLVIFTQCGAGTSEAAQHSQCLEAWFAHVPGLKVVMPATVADAKGLLKASIRDDNPVVYIWHKLLYDLKEEVPDGEFVTPLGRAAVRREGTDVTLVATSLMVHRALAAANALAGEVSIELIDLRTIVPWDVEAVLASVAKTGRLLVVHEANVQFGVGAEIVRRVVEEAFDSLRAAPVVLGAAPVPIPFAHVLESAAVPQQADIAAAVRRIVASHTSQPHLTLRSETFS
jgi:acetoin:2,6-dichlorophenolindophenol oxidoreductase subunit beta